jgi:4-hydroxy-tetrahydrodipicolinate synthase
MRSVDSMFSGLSAFPLTPMDEARVDEAALGRLVERLVDACVDSIGVLGSTGSYAYLDRAERARLIRVAVDRADGVPVLAGIGALRSREVLSCAEDAQRAGARALLLAPVSYQRLTSDEVFSLFESVCRNVSVPLCVYDNPVTTHFDFTDELHERIAELPSVHSIKIPPVPLHLPDAQARVAGLRSRIRAGVTIGISGDASAETGLAAGCQLWYSVLGGLLPKTCVSITQAALAGDVEAAAAASAADWTTTAAASSAASSTNPADCSRCWRSSLPWVPVPTNSTMRLERTEPQP